MVHVFSEDGTMRRFVPAVLESNPAHPPVVQAVDAAHAPLYWFPRMVPRISVWARSAADQEVLTERFGTEASRICAAENESLAAIRSTRLYRYTFDGAPFSAWGQGEGQFVASVVVRPERVDPIDDLIDAHAAAGVELRLTPRLGALMDAVLSSGLPFGFVRIRDARR
ncbi:MAG: hypothetical protein RLZZ01_1811 [Actinomycetota bacterium]